MLLVAERRERVYWDKRYAAGQPSGNRSSAVIRQEWEIIDEHIPQLGVVTDIGCGDLRFWEDKWDKVSSYIGVDISQEIIEKNRAIHFQTGKAFFCMPAEEYCSALEAHTVFCLNTLFHIMDTVNFYKILENICQYAKRHIVLSTWMKNPFNEGDTDNHYQRYTPFDVGFVETRGFKLVAMKEFGIKGFYIFRRV